MNDENVMTLGEVVARAQRCLDHGCIYKLGQGGMNPRAEWPWDKEKELDCSGFAMWCCGISRMLADGWLNTDAIVKDGKTPGGLFERIAFEDSVPGNLLVYGRGTASYGHIGVISQVGNDGPVKAIHCSNGNWKKLRDAVQETGLGPWRVRPDSIAVRCLSVDESGGPA